MMMMMMMMSLEETSRDSTRRRCWCRVVRVMIMLMIMFITTTTSTSFITTTSVTASRIRSGGTSVRASSASSTSSSILSVSLVSPPTVRSVQEEEETEDDDFTIGTCLVALGRYDLNQNKEVNRTEFQYVIQHVCADHGNATAVTQPNQTQWDLVFVEAACACQLYSRRKQNQSDTTTDDDNDDEPQNCCDPTRVDANVLYRPGRYSSNYTYTICQYLHSVFLQYDCITAMDDDDDELGATNLPTTSPMSLIVGTAAPTALPSTWLPTLSVNNNSSSESGSNSSNNDTDTKLSSGILIVLIFLSFMIGTMLIYISKKTILDKLVRPNKNSNEKAVVHDEAEVTDHYDDTVSPTFTDEYSVCCWWTQSHRRCRSPHESDTIAVAAIARGSVIQQKHRHESTAHELSCHYDDEEKYRPQVHTNCNDNLDSEATTHTQRRSSGKRKKKDDNVVVLVVPATSPEHDDTVTNHQRNTAGTTTTNTDHMDDDPTPSQMMSVSSSGPRLPQPLYYRDDDADTEPYNDLMYAGSNQYFDHATATTTTNANTNTNSTNNYLNMVLLRQQQQIQAIIRESDDDDDDTDVNVGIYTDDLDDASSDTSSGNSTSSSADSSKSPSTLERVHNNYTNDIIHNSTQRSALLQQVEENDIDDVDVDPDNYTASSSSSTSSAGIISNTSSMVALLSDPLLPQSLCNYEANHSSIFNHGHNVIATKRPTTITTTLQTALEDASRANVDSETYTTALTTTMTPTKAKHVKSHKDEDSHKIVSKTLISSSLLTQSVVITPESNETDRDDDDHHDVDDDDINSLLQQYQQKSLLLSQESAPNLLDGANDVAQLDSDHGAGTSGDEDKIGTPTTAPSITTSSRSLGAGNTPIGISPSNDDYNVTLQWNTNPTATAPTTSTSSVTQESNDTVDCNNVATPRESLAPPTTQGSMDDMSASDDATTVVVSNQKNPASLLFRKVFHSPHPADRRRTNDTTTTAATHPKGPQKGTTTRSRPPVQTVITKNKTVATP